jgi:hypothetical protein
VDPDTVSVVALRNVDTHTLSALTDSSPEEWDAHLASLGESLVLVSGTQARQAIERVLRQHGAREILASDDQFAAETTAEPEQQPPPPPVEMGMTVMSSDHREVGRVKRIGKAAMLVARPLRPDVWVPFTAVDRSIERWVVLKLPFQDVDVPASLLLKH